MKHRSRKSFVLWLTGLSGSGKTTLGKKLFAYLKKQGLAAEFLDGDEIRKVLPNTGFSKNDRLEHIRRMGYLASLLEKNGIITIASFISPHREARKFARNLCSNFIEIYLETPLQVCIERDPKGLYKKAQNGKVKNFTGLSSDYEPPTAPEITINTHLLSIDEAINKIKEYLIESGYLA